MELIKLLLVFLVIIMVMWMKKPLAVAVVAGSLAASVLFGLGFSDTWKAVKSGALGNATIQLLVVFYLITYLQRMLEKRKSLAGAQEGLNGLFNNRRINASLAPSLLGLLPAAATVKLCGEIVRNSTDGFLKTEEQACITSYFRHIPELFLPTYTSILIAIELTEGRVSVGLFVLAMLPMMAMLFLIGDLFFLRKVPRDAGAVRNRTAGGYLWLLLKSLWPLILTIVLIIAWKLPVHVSVLISIVLYIAVGRFKVSELLPMIKSAVEPKLLISTFLVMIFKEILSATGIIESLPGFFRTLPIPTFLIFALIFFFGTIISGSQAIIVLCTGMAMATAEAGQSVLALFVLLMSMTYAAMQLSPVHICLEICAEDYGISMGALIKKTAPLIAAFAAIALIYYGFLSIISL